MAMKQTQTKLFDFSDVGLDFCAGSKNLFPDRFKKMLALGYNEQTVSSVAVSSNQVVFTYGGAHGYKAERVLKINSGALAAINDGEFWIDSVTTNTVTITIDGAPLSVSGGFTTKIASLGWSPEYENANIYVYKFKALDESDLYLRLCFQTNLTHRNAIAVCIGKSYDVSSGAITDESAYTYSKDITNVSSNVYKWEFTMYGGATYNDWTYNNSEAYFGKAKVVGSKYHLLLLSHLINIPNGSAGVINGFAPSHCYDYEQLGLPALFAYKSNSTSTDLPSNTNVSSNFAVLIGEIVCKTLTEYSLSGYGLASPIAIDSFLPDSIEGFNTSTTQPIQIYESTTGQFLGYVNGCIQRVSVGITNNLSPKALDAPAVTQDVDLGNTCLIHNVGYGSSLVSAAHFAIPVEEIKID